MMETKQRNGLDTTYSYGETGMPNTKPKAKWKRILPRPEQTLPMLAHGATIYVLWRVVEALHDLVSVLAHHSTR